MLCLQSMMASTSLAAAVLDKLSSYVSVVMGVGICVFILVVVALWFAVEAAQGFGGVSKKTCYRRRWLLISV